MARKEYDYGIRTLAEQLYVFHGRTYEEIAGETGVSRNQLKRWGKSAEWRQKREQYLKSKAQDLVRIMNIKERILQELESQIQPNVVHQLLSALRQAEAYIDGKLGIREGDREPDEDRGRGLTDEAVDAIRKDILGIGDERAAKKRKPKP